MCSTMYIDRFFSYLSGLALAREPEKSSELELPSFAVPK